MCRRAILAVVIATASCEIPDPVPPGIDAMTGADTAPTSCLSIHAATPGYPSGDYAIDPDGPGGNRPVIVTCDMTTDGGGWTIVFLSPTPNIPGLPVVYTVGTAPLRSYARSALLAYRGPTLISYGDYAQFDLPVIWRTETPFNVGGTDLVVDVSVNNGTASATTLRFGRSNFSASCSDPWTTGDRGRICVLGTKAPFFSGFSSTVADMCADSLSGSAAIACADDRRFSIAVR